VEAGTLIGVGRIREPWLWLGQSAREGEGNKWGEGPGTKKRGSALIGVQDVDVCPKSTETGGRYGPVSATPGWCNEWLVG